MAITDAEIKQFSDALREAAQAARNLAAEHSSMVREQLRNSADATDEFTESLRDANTGIISEDKVRRKLNEQQAKEIKLKKEVAKLTEQHKQTVRDHGAASQKATDALNKLADAESQLADSQGKSSKLTDLLGKGFGKLGKGVKIAEAGLRFFGTASVSQGRELIKHYQEAGGIIEGSGGLFTSMMEQQQKAFKLGVSGSQLQALSNQHRQLFNAMGGTNQALDDLNPAIKRFRTMTGDNEQALQLAADAARHFAEKGIVPSGAAIEAYTNDMDRMRIRLGIDYKEASALFNEVASDSESIDILRSARADERESILASQRAYVENAIAMGMTARQAKEAAKMLNKMVAAKPLDRLRQAAKIRALGGAMGIAGSEEAAQALISGKKDAASKQALADFNTNAANMMDTMAGQGLGAEIFSTTLLEKLDLEQYLGKGSEFSTTLGPSLQAQTDALKSFQVASNTNEGVIINKLTEMLGQLGLIASGKSWMGMAAGAIATGIGALLTEGLFDKLADVVKGVGKGTASTLGTGGALSKAGTAAKAVAKRVPVVGGVLAAGDEYLETGNVTKSATRGVGTTTGSMIGGAVGMLGGPVGALAGSIVGGMVGNWLGGMAGDALSTPDKEATPVPSDSLTPEIEKLTAAMKENQQLMQSKKVYGVMLDETAAKLKEFSDQSQLSRPLFNTKPVEMTPLQPQQKRELDTKKDQEKSEEAMSAALSTADGVSKQVLLMDTSNMLLKQLTDLSQRQVDLSEKQLVALTLTEREKTNVTNRSNLMKDNKFGASYNYV